MSLKRILGTILTLLGVCGLIYAAIFFVTATGNNQDVILLLIFWTLGISFFAFGINLIRNTKEEY